MELRMQRIAQLVISDAKDREIVAGILAKNGQWAAVEKRHKAKQDGSASRNVEYVVSVAAQVVNEGVCG